MSDAYQQPPKQSNRLFACGVIVAIAFVTPVLCCGVLGFLGFRAVTAPLQAVATVLEQDPRVTARIGMPIEYDDVSMTNIQIDGGVGSAKIDTNCSGPDGKVRVRGDMTLQDGAWVPEQLTVLFEDETEIEIPGADPSED